METIVKATDIEIGDMVNVFGRWVEVTDVTETTIWVGTISLARTGSAPVIKKGNK